MKPLETRLSDLDDPDLVSTFDELPLWSAPFGIMLLDVVRMKKGMTVLDIGCGAGFPLIELAQRFGNSCTLYGIDPWKSGLDHIRRKLRQYDLHNVTLINDVAENLPFKDSFFDLIVSNNGINNVADPAMVLNNCYRVSKTGAQFVMTLNLEATMKEFYDVFESVLRERNLDATIAAMKAHIKEKRPPLMEVFGLIEWAGFRITATHENLFSMRFIDGTTMFDHYLIRLGFRAPWEKLLTDTDHQGVFEEVEKRLNGIAAQQGEIKLTIPYACIIAEKP